MESVSSVRSDVKDQVMLATLLQAEISLYNICICNVFVFVLIYWHCICICICPDLFALYLYLS